MTAFKTHVALRVKDLSQSLAFNQTLFDLKPIKHKMDYAKFDVENPGLNLTLNVGGDSSDRGTLSHLGIQVDSSEAVEAAIARFKTVGLATFEEKDTDCCYALQDKVWVTDPDNNRWEIFVVKIADTSPATNVSASNASVQVQSACCP